MNLENETNINHFIFEAIHTRDSKDVGGANDTKNNYKVLAEYHKKAVEMRIDSSLFQGKVREGSLVPITVTLNYNRNSYTITVQCNSSTVGISEKADDRLLKIVHKSSDFNRNITLYIRERNFISSFVHNIIVSAITRRKGKKSGQ